MRTVAGARAVPSYLLASPAARIGGYLADFLILLPVSVGVMVLLPGAWMFAVHLVMFVYFSVQHALWGRTLGKRMAGTRVVRAVDLGPITWRQAAVREALNNFLRVIPLGGPALNAIDVLWVFGDRNRQALHDKAAHTIVVQNKSALPSPPYRPASVDA